MLAPRKKGIRSRAEAATERQQLLDRTRAEIDKLAAEYFNRMPRENADSIGAIYARYSTDVQDSVRDQIRSMLEAAVKNRIHVPPENIHFDLAIQGYRNRPGFNALRATLAARRAQVLLVFSTSRLFRKLYKALKFIEEEVVEKGLRCLFVQNNLDTDDGDRWRFPFHMYAAMDESGNSIYSEAIRSGQLGLFYRRIVTGTLSLGYVGEPIPGEFTKKFRPRCLIVIDPVAAKWVIQIFSWYLEDRLAIREIARRLNADPDAPPPLTSPTGIWTDPPIVRLLSNRRYRGFWQYGKTKRIYVSHADSFTQILREEPLGSAFFEELRIVGDDVWYATQGRLLKEPNNRGRQPVDGERSSHPKLLNRTFFCPDHDQMLYADGANSVKMACLKCLATRHQDRPLTSHLNRALAFEVTCQRLAELLRADDEFVRRVIAACQQEAARAQRPDPKRLGQLKAQANELEKTIMFNRGNPGVTEVEQKKVAELIRRLGIDHNDVMMQIVAAEAAQNRRIKVPTAQAVKRRLRELTSRLMAAAHSTDEEEQESVGEIIRSLTGGRIDLYQRGERKPKRGWLEGRCTVRLLDYLVTGLIGASPTIEHEGIKITFTYRKPRPSAAMSEQAFELHSQGVLHKAIGLRLRCAPSRVTKLLHDAYDLRGLKMPDGRKRRSTLETKHLIPPMYQQIADRAKAMSDGDGLLREIAAEIRCNISTLTAAIAYWHRRSRGLPVPDGRSRRKRLPRKSSKPRAEAEN